MNIKNTPLWKKAKKIKANHIQHKQYRKAKKMPLTEYENYLVSRTFEMMNRFSYSKNFSYFINFDNPETFTEKMQWLKLYDQDERKTLFTDKYAVRRHIEKILGKDYLIPLISIDGKECFDSVKEIDFDKLPNSFVIKCTHGSHMNIIVKDKASLSKKDIRDIKKKLKRWLSIDYSFVVGLELQYHNIKPRIIIEKYIETDDISLVDYKFFCFDGEVKFLSVNENRGTNKYTETYLDCNFKKLPYSYGYYETNDNPKKPNHFQEMLSIAHQLCSGFIFVRVDLYENNGCVFFGELTFSPGAGFEFPNPMKHDREFGKLLNIDTSKRDGNYTYRKNEDH